MSGKEQVVGQALVVTEKVRLVAVTEALLESEPRVFPGGLRDSPAEPEVPAETAAVLLLMRNFGAPESATR